MPARLDLLVMAAIPAFGLLLPDFLSLRCPPLLNGELGQVSISCDCAPPGRRFPGAALAWHVPAVLIMLVVALTPRFPTPMTSRRRSA